MPKRNSKYRWVRGKDWYYQCEKSIFGCIHRGIDGKWVASCFKGNVTSFGMAVTTLRFPKTLAEGKAFIEKYERANRA